MVSGPLSGNTNTTRGVIRIDADFAKAIADSARLRAQVMQMSQGINQSLGQSGAAIRDFNEKMKQLRATALGASQAQKNRARDARAAERTIQRGIAETAKARQAAFKENQARMRAEVQAVTSLERQKQQAIRATESQRRRQFRESQQAARQLQQTLIGLSVSAGLVTRQALESADRLARFEASFKAILGSEQKVADLMEKDKSTFGEASRKLRETEPGLFENLEFTQEVKEK